jgi:hypothetical protein
MNKHFAITTAVGLVLATTAFAQNPNERSRTQNQPPAATTTTPSTTTPSAAPSTSTTSQSAPAAGTTAQSPAPATNPNTTQTQTPPASGTTSTQSSPPAPAAAQTTPSTQQPASNQAQTPASTTQPGTAQSPAPATQPSTAQTPAPATQPSTAQTPAPATRPSTAQTPSSNTNVSAQVNIAPQQQTRITQSIARLNVQPLTNVNFSISVGGVVPRNLRLQTLPPDIVTVVPQFRNHRFVVVRDEIVIIEPSSYRIVAVLPRSGGSTAAAPAPAQKKLKFSNREREVLRTHTRTKREAVTTGSSARAQVRIGDRVPDTVELREFPSTVYRTVPTVREYRYMQMDDRSYLVEPRQRVIIEEID